MNNKKTVKELKIAINNLIIEEKKKRQTLKKISKKYILYGTRLAILVCSLIILLIIATGISCIKIDSPEISVGKKVIKEQIKLYNNTTELMDHNHINKYYEKLNISDKQALEQEMRLLVDAETKHRTRLENNLNRKGN